MKKINISELLFHVLFPILIGGAIGLLFKDYTSYIESLDRLIKVPALLFPIVWSILYSLIGIWYHFYEKEAARNNKILYYVLLILNFLFTPVLFYFENIVLALIITILLFIGNLYLFINSLRHTKLAYLLLPYLLWLVFACVLMTDLLINNVIR